MCRACSLDGGLDKLAGRKAYIRAFRYEFDAADQIFAACQNDPAWSTYSVDCGHDIMLDRPDELSAILEKAAE